jgi:hypothetical protein
MSTIVRTQFDTSTNKDMFKTLVKNWWNLSDREAMVEYPNVVKTLTTQDEYERLGRWAGLEYPGSVPEGQAIGIQDPKFGQVKDYSQDAFGTGFRITHRMKKFEKVGLFEFLVKDLKKVQKEGKDVEIARMFNNMTATTYATGFDSLAIAHDSHTCLDDASTTYDNYLNAALSTSALESVRNYYNYMYDDQAQIITAVPDTLVVNYSLITTAEELLGSSQKAHELSNTKNVLKGWLDIFLYHRLTSTTCWFVIAKKDPLYGYYVWTSQEPEVRTKDAPDTTWDSVCTSLQYFKYGCADPRMLYCGDT